MLNAGCHAVLFGERIKTETGYILENLAKTGFAGIEAGFRFFGEAVPVLADELKKQGLLLAGFHAGTKFADFLLAPEKTGELLYRIADKLLEVPKAVMPFRNIIMSSSYEGFTAGELNGEPNALSDAARRLNEIAGRVKEKGVMINYHNHSREFADQGLIYKTLQTEAPEVNFGFDLGWVTAGGGDVTAILKDNPGRVHYVHLRDIASNGKDFVDLGRGVSDLPGMTTLVKEITGEDGWMVVEYETGEQDFGRYSRAREYLRTIGF
jgi:sugar phosphate isomerase/epimerase